jgi:Ca2+-binding EF-hand superfamily protein
MMPIAPIWTRSISFTPGVIPEKFKRVDTDGDGYVSFSELLSAIEKFFDGSLEVSVEEIYELNNYFFSQ